MATELVERQKGAANLNNDTHYTLGTYAYLIDLLRLTILIRQHMLCCIESQILNSSSTTQASEQAEDNGVILVHQIKNTGLTESTT